MALSQVFTCDDARASMARRSRLAEKANLGQGTSRPLVSRGPPFYKFVDNNWRQRSPEWASRTVPVKMATFCSLDRLTRLSRFRK